MTLWRYAGLAVLAIALLIAALIGLAPTWLRLGLTLYGIDDVRFASFDIGLTTVELKDLEIGTPTHQAVGLIRIDYTLGDLMDGHVDRVTIEKASVQMDVDDTFPENEKAAGSTSFTSLPAAAFVDELIVEDGRIDLETPMGLLTLPISGHVRHHRNDVAFKLRVEEASIGLPGKEISANFALEGMLPLNDEPILDRLAASGKLSINANDATIVGIAEALEGAGDIFVDVRDGKLEATTDSLSMTTRRLHIDTGPVQGPWALILGDGDRPLQIHGDHREDGWHLAVEGPLKLSAEPGTVIANLDAALALDEGGVFESLDRGLVTLDSKDLSLIEGNLAAAKARLEAQGKLDALDGALSVKLDGLSWSDDDHALRDVDLEQTIDLAFDGNVLDLSIKERGRIAVGQIAVGDELESGWFTVRLRPNDTPAVRISPRDRTWQHQLNLEIDPVRMETPAGQWWARIEDFSITAAGDFDSTYNSQLVIKQGRADWPQSNLALTGIESDLRLTSGDADEGETIPLIIRAIRPLDEPKLFSPFRLDADIVPSDPLAFDGRVRTKAGAGAAISFSGRFQQATGEGALTFDLPNLTFDPNGLQPEDLSPLLQDVLADVSGSVAVTGDLTWGADDVSSKADFLIEELGLSIGPARLERVNTLLRFDSLTPPTTLPGQELAIALLDVGLPLTDGVVSMQLEADGRLSVDRLTWRFADGEVQARPFTFGSDVQDLTMVLDVNQLDLNGLLGLTKLDGLSGEGRIDGELPLTISESGALIADGKLSATQAGVLRYKPDETPGVLQSGGESIGLMLQALENFHYDELDITLDGRTDGETDIGLHIRGANPELYDGYPIEFNLDLKGDLANIVRTNLSNYQIPDRIRERLQGFGQ